VVFGCGSLQFLTVAAMTHCGFGCDYNDLSPIPMDAPPASGDWAGCGSGDSGLDVTCLGFSRRGLWLWFTVASGCGMLRFLTVTLSFSLFLSPLPPTLSLPYHLLPFRLLQSCISHSICIL